MRVFLTGASGFLGSHLLKRLVEERVETAILLRDESEPWRIRALLGSVRQIKGAMRNVPAFADEIKSFGPDTVIHAAWSGVMNKFRNDSEQLDANVMPSINLLRTCIEGGCKHFVGLGSQAEYGPHDEKIEETDLPRPTTLYGASKLATSVLAESICAQAGVRFAWVRVFSTYGPMEELEWMIPYLIRKLLRNEKPSLTACEQRWDYLFGPDAAEAILKVAQSPGARGIFNLASGRVYTLREIIEKIRDQIDSRLPLGIGEVPYRPDQVMHLEGDITKLRSAIGWTPSTPLDEGLAQTIAWHRHNSNMEESR